MVLITGFQAPPLLKKYLFNQIFFIAFASACAIGLMQYATSGRIAYTMDSLTYRDVAINFLTGRPWQATNVTQSTPEFEALTLWPPAYPALWAFVTQLAGSSIDAPLVWLNATLLCLTTFLIFLNCRMATGSALAACIVASVNAFTPSCMIVFGHAWSETLFNPIVLLVYVALWKYRESKGGMIWLIVAAISIGMTNWIRYAGVVFLPIMGISILLVSDIDKIKRLLHATGAVTLSILLSLPLWLRNWQLTGNISGSNRGGVPKTDRLAEDIGTIIDLFEHAFFDFDMVIRAHLELPIIAVFAFLIYRVIRSHRIRKTLTPEVWLPAIWLTGYLGFLLFARVRQSGVPMDFRMLSTAFPFLLIGVAPAVKNVFSDKSLTTSKALTVLLLGLMVFTGFNEAQRTRDNYAIRSVPGWRATFGLAFRDMRDTTPTSRALQEQIVPTKPGTIILTDYRALYIRYLTGALAYSPYSDSICDSAANRNVDGIVLIADKELPLWADNCLKKMPHWQLLRPTGRAAPSMNAD